MRQAVIRRHGAADVFEMRESADPVPGVVIGLAAEELHADDGFFELVRSPEKLLLHDKPKKAAEPIVARKTRAGEDLLQLGADKLRI